MTAESFADLRPCLLVYDVPTRSGVANPSGRLRRIAFRVNLSAWVIREDDVPRAYLARIALQGVKWRIVRFDPSEAANLVQLGIENIRVELRAAVSRARAAADRYAAELESGEATTADYVRSARAQVKRLRKLLVDLQAAGMRFGITATQLNLSAATAACEAINAGMREKCFAYANAAEVLRDTKTKEGQALAALVEADEVPAEVVADWLRDHGGGPQTQAANRLQNTLFW